MIDLINDAIFLEDNGKSIYKIYLFIIRIIYLMLMICFKFDAALPRMQHQMRDEKDYLIWKLIDGLNILAKYIPK